MTCFPFPHTRNANRVINGVGKLLLAHGHLRPLVGIDDSCCGDEGTPSVERSALFSGCGQITQDLGSPAQYVGDAVKQTTRSRRIEEKGRSMVEESPDDTTMEI